MTDLPAAREPAPDGPFADLARYYRDLPVLVTGGLGFIGSNVARRLLELGARVTVVDALWPNFGGHRANLADVAQRMRVHEGDMADAAVIEPLIAGQAVIFNIAGHVSHIDSMEHPLVDEAANVRAQIGLLEARRRLAPKAKVVFTSTRQIYGRPAYLPVDEAHPLAPVDVNGIHKMAGEALHRLQHAVYGLDTVALRLTNVFGPRMRVKDARQTFLGIWLRRVVEGGVFEVWGGEQLRDLCYVEDAADALLLAGMPEFPAGSVMNLGGCGKVSLRELADRLVRIAGGGRYDLHPFPSDRKRIDIGDYYADDSRFRAATGWFPRVGLDEALARSVAFYRRHLATYV